MQKFTGVGDFLATWGSFGTGEGQFSSPYAIRPGADGVVYVADSSNHRVQKFLFVPCNCPADVNVDLLIDGGDIQPFVDCLLGNGSNCECADLDGVAGLDFNDVAAFVSDLVGGEPCP